MPPTITAHPTDITNAPATLPLPAPPPANPNANPNLLPPTAPPPSYPAPLGTRWAKEKAAAGGSSAFDLPTDPKTIGPWVLGECIGKGASGRVKIARHVRTGVLAAVKILPVGEVQEKEGESGREKEKEREKQEKQRLGVDREITMMKLMNHPNIMRLYDVYQTSHSLFLILEYVQGGELFDFLVNKGRLPPKEALLYFRQIICGLNYAHTFSIIHRDLKPENILIASLFPPVVKIADWGMATFAPPSQHLDTSCGSPHYASPEIVNGEKYQGSSTDIWSCGVILYALLTGRLPFDDKNVRTLLAKVKAGKYDMPSWIDPLAKDLLSKMLVVDVKERITIPDILSHPWLAPSPSSSSSTPGFDTYTSPSGTTYTIPHPPLPPSPSLLARPIPSPSLIDPELFASLQIIWGRHADKGGECIKRDLCARDGGGIHAKAFYFLLCKYREETRRGRRGEDADVGSEDVWAVGADVEPSTLISEDAFAESKSVKMDLDLDLVIPSSPIQVDVDVDGSFNIAWDFDDKKPLDMRLPLSPIINNAASTETRTSKNAEAILKKRTSVSGRHSQSQAQTYNWAGALSSTPVRASTRSGTGTGAGSAAWTRDSSASTSGTGSETQPFSTSTHNRKYISGTIDSGGTSAQARTLPVGPRPVSHFSSAMARQPATASRPQSQHQTRTGTVTLSTARKPNTQAQVQAQARDPMQMDVDSDSGSSELPYKNYVRARSPTSRVSSHDNLEGSAGGQRSISADMDFAMTGKGTGSATATTQVDLLTFTKGNVVNPTAENRPTSSEDRPRVEKMMEDLTRMQTTSRGILMDIDKENVGVIAARGGGAAMGGPFSSLANGPRAGVALREMGRDVSNANTSQATGESGLTNLPLPKGKKDRERKPRPPPLDLPSNAQHHTSTSRRTTFTTLLSSPISLSTPMHPSHPHPSSHPHTHSRIASSPVVGEFKGWFTNLFNNWKSSPNSPLSMGHASGSGGVIYSGLGVRGTRKEVCRLFESFGNVGSGGGGIGCILNVVVQSGSHGHGEPMTPITATIGDPHPVEILSCRVDHPFVDVKNGVSVIYKNVRFRIEFRGAPLYGETQSQMLSPAPYYHTQSHEQELRFLSPPMTPLTAVPLPQTPWTAMHTPTFTPTQGAFPSPLPPPTPGSSTAPSTTTRSRGSILMGRSMTSASSSGPGPGSGSASSSSQTYTASNGNGTGSGVSQSGGLKLEFPPGSQCAIVLVHEKGSMSTFRTIWRVLREEFVIGPVAGYGSGHPFGGVGKGAGVGGPLSPGLGPQTPYPGMEFQSQGQTQNQRLTM